MFRRRRKSKFYTRNYSAQFALPSTNAGAVTAVDTPIFGLTTLSTENQLIQKKVIIAGIHWYSDLYATNSPTGAANCQVYECMYIDTLNVSGTPRLASQLFLTTNQMSATFADTLYPDRVFWRRHATFTPAIGGAPASFSNNWLPIHSKMKGAMKGDDALIYRIEMRNNAGAALSTSFFVIAAITFRVTEGK